MGLTPIPADFPAWQIHYTGKLRMQCPCFADHLFHGGIGGAKPKAGKDCTAVRWRLVRHSLTTAEALQRIVGRRGCAPHGNSLATQLAPFDLVSVYILPMSDFHDAYYQNIILDFIQHPIDSTTQPVFL